MRIKSIVCLMMALALVLFSPVTPSVSAAEVTGKAATSGKVTDPYVVSYKIETYTDNDTTETTITEYSYDKYGHVTEEKITGENAVTVFKYGYDGNSLISESKTITRNNGKYLYYKYEYDTEGRETAYIENDGTYQTERHTEYDEAGNIVKTVSSQSDKYDGDTYSEVTEYAYIYNADGKLTRETSYYNGVKRYESEYTYDDAGRLILSKDINKNGKTINLSEYTYDDQGRQTESHSFYDDGYEDSETLEAWNTTKYDENGRVIERFFWSSDNGIVDLGERKVYTYDQSGNCIKEEYYDYDWPETTVTIYNSFGKVISRTILKDDGDNISTENYTYDERGNETSYIRNSSDYNYIGGYTVRVEEEKYEYDDNFELIYSVYTYDVKAYNGDGDMSMHQIKKSEKKFEGGILIYCLNSDDIIDDGIASGTITETYYDSDGHILSSVMTATSDGNIRTVQEHLYTYRKVGRFLVEQGTFKNEYAYDDNGRLFSTVNENTKTIYKYRVLSKAVK